MFVLTIDQRRSRAEPDRLPSLIDALRGVVVLRPFERTAGDELQGVLHDAAAVVEAVLRIVRDGGWSAGVGIGSAREPLPPSTREGAGQAFELARAAVEDAKASPTRLSVKGPPGSGATDAEAVLRLLADLVARRTPPGWEVVDLLAEGRSQSEVAVQIGVTRQAVHQRTWAAGWPLEQDCRPVAAWLLGRSDEAS